MTGCPDQCVTKSAVDTYKDAPCDAEYRQRGGDFGLIDSDQGYFDTNKQTEPVTTKGIVEDLHEVVGDDASIEAICSFVNDDFRSRGHWGGVSDGEQQTARDQLPEDLANAYGLDPAGT